MMTRVLRVLWISLGLLAPPGRMLNAQQTLAVALGSKIRVQPEGETKWLVGRLTGVAPDTIRLQQCKSCLVASYSLPSLSGVEVSMGRTRRGSTILAGALLGAAVGMGSGMLYGWKQTRRCKGDGNCGLAYLAVPIFGTGGLAIGAAVGGSLKYDDWRPASIR
jgi:hypothetical protein